MLDDDNLILLVLMLACVSQTVEDACAFDTIGKGVRTSNIFQFPIVPATTVLLKALKAEGPNCLGGHWITLDTLA